MRYPTVNMGALGRASLFPSAPQPSTAPCARVLGVTGSTAAASGAGARFQAAQELLARVERTYPKLVALTGEESAREAFDQATQSMELARRDYEEALRVGR
jgi:hypothetical protein